MKSHEVTMAIFHLLMNLIEVWPIIENILSRFRFGVPFALAS